MVRSVTTRLAAAAALALFGCASGPTPEETTAPTRAAQAPAPEPAPRPADPPAPRDGDSITDWRTLPDFDDLRAEYAARPDFSELCERGAELQQAVRLLEEQDWIGLTGAAENILAHCPVDIDAHLLQTIALGNLGREEAALAHQRWRRGLVGSILRSGDGRSTDDAWVVISVAEEYALLRALGARPTGQSLLEGGFHAITVDWEGRTMTLYFKPVARPERMQ
jgi:hypothetical protein